MNNEKILAEAMLEQQKYGQLCPETIEELKKIRVVSMNKVKVLTVTFKSDDAHLLEKILKLIEQCKYNIEEFEI